ncbi:PucR family transcriptional regulator ligand-binding domain-containing protein [Solirubrobacter phytolaccae]|uniref:PucR family transcriptional regulator ligand-binding domain-containing protein n=1 Tax=Solirubrobacter phytolaccae TaxID=1404360 RepID=A0A9X3NDK6_9ACTN|nr:PucR family transcriptional regulator [Solirubrobacter phytolaccae]MDA0183249.1 PucR family transcriptional regulator ligand-binding domain-containing protein [Solirubrobacter phytolaccae]
MLPLRELLRELELEVVAGEAGLDRALRWVHISELEDPTPWLSGGELLLTTGLGLGDAAHQRAYLERLARHELAGLGFGTGFTHARVPEALREAAAELGFPLFEVPYATPFIAITERAASQLVNEQYAVLRRALSAHERLEQIVLSERGLDGVVSALGAMIGGPALILDARGDVLARRSGRAALDPAPVVAELRERLAGGARRGYVPGADGFPAGALALPVARGDAALPEAWLIAARESGPLNELDRLTLHQAVTIVALELLRRRVVDDTERRLAGDVLSALVAGDLAGAELARRLEPFGVRERAGVLVLAPPRGVRAVTEEALARAVREEAGGGLVAGSGQLVCALIPASGDDELFALAGRLLARVEREADTALAAGAGRCVAPGELRRGFHEARCALEARALAVNGSGPGTGLATYRDLGSFQLLLSLQDDDALRLFCDSILAPIEDSEGAYGGELMRSLEAFIECNGQWERAAKALFCHRHTLRYRIRRVEELTGRSLDSARDRIDFWLALRGRELVQPER